MISAAQNPENLGRRIMVIGPAGAGKSTLTAVLAQHLDLPAIHLDLLFHTPNTDWVPRPAEEFEQLHTKAVAQSEWIIDGNYRKFMPPRLARATGLVWIDPPLHQNVWGYLKRCFAPQNVPGRLPGGSERVKWLMVHHILVTQPRSHAQMRTIFEGFEGEKLRFGSSDEAAKWMRNGLLPNRNAEPP